MLKKMSIRKIIISTLTLFILLIIYLIPSNETKEIELKNDKVEYTYSNNLNPIYLLDSNDYIARTSIKTSKTDIIEKAKELIEGLIIDGQKSNIIPNGFKSIIPPETQILDIKLQEGTLTINFSKELLDINEKYEEKMIEAITYTLTSIKDINNIIIQVEGEVLTKLPKSGKQLPSVLDKSYGINKIYELTSTKDITSYTTYYVSSYNDNYYYVPVTKYINNKNQDKIKVIIEEMSSAPIYESNLMSFLNVNTKLLDYEQEENTLKLNFNDMILSDITSNNILEEVIYTISLSMNDMLDVTEIIFYVDDEEIYTSNIENIM